MSHIRVMSFNIFSPGPLEPGDEFPPEELPNDWPDRAPLNLRTIQRYAPDIAIEVAGDDRRHGLVLLQRADLAQEQSTALGSGQDAVRTILVLGVQVQEHRARVPRAKAGPIDCQWIGHTPIGNRLIGRRLDPHP